MGPEDYFGADTEGFTRAGGTGAPTQADLTLRGLSGIRTLFTSEPTKQFAYVDQCVVLGRFAMRRGMTSSEALALASTAWSASQMKQYVLWNLKKVAKRLGGASYERTRKNILRRRLR